MNNGADLGPCLVDRQVKSGFLGRLGSRGSRQKFSATINHHDILTRHIPQRDTAGRDEKCIAPRQPQAEIAPCCSNQMPVVAKPGKMHQIICELTEFINDAHCVAFLLRVANSAAAWIAQTRFVSLAMP